MLTCANEYCRLIVDTIAACGVRTAYCSPGSRNAPLLLALEGHGEIEKHVVVDERSAAFQALGCSLIERRPVVLVCTSGTAVLDYAPAVAEAYYAGVPLIVVSADRPAEWIDQDDSQTIRQHGALANIVKGSFNLRAVPESVGANEAKERLWAINRTVNEAMLMAADGKPGPVHINVQLGEPLAELAEVDPPSPRAIMQISSEQTLPKNAVKALADDLKGKKIMLVAGFMQPDNKLDRAVRKLASLPEVAVFAETLSNLHEPQPYASMIDSVLCTLSDDEKERLRPDVVISIGGALVSRMLKQYLREFQPARHLGVGHSNYFCDCFKCLSDRIPVAPAPVLTQLANAISRSNSPSDSSDYSRSWNLARHRAACSAAEYVAKAPWSDLKAMDAILRRFPNDNVFLSNGTPVRYAQIIPHDFHAEYCNRGVSGIDGSTSAAVGAGRAYNGYTSLISGDMSWLYDSGASALCNPPEGMRFFVIDNSGGGIFRFIKSTSGLPEDILRKYFCSPMTADISGVAEAYGMETREVSDEDALLSKLEWMADDSATPKLLLVHTPPAESAHVLKNFFTREKSSILNR